MRDIRPPHGANRLLDVGCGSGSLLARYQALGWSVRGVEMNARACAACRERGLQVHQGTVFDAPLKPRQFDVILLNHVIEHVLDPIAVLARAGEFLAPGGRLIVVTPNIDGIGFSLYGSCWYPLDAPRHVVLFSPRTMRRLGDEAALVTRRVETQSAPRMLSESRHYAETQGRQLPPGVERRAEILRLSALAKKPHKGFRKLVTPLTAAFALFGRGDIMEAEYTLPAQEQRRG
jgi:SAM-dependent methyltransferase